ncbi:MAG: tetratricopeptide repeat protein [Methanoregula sp.]
MDFRKFPAILAILLVTVLVVQPVLSATTTTSDNLEKDIATSYFNNAQRLLAACAPGASCDYESAIKMYDQALASNTTMLEKTDGLLYLYQGKAYAQIQLENYSAAVATVDAGLAVYPKDAMLWNNRGYALYRLGKTQDALTAYDKSVSFDGNYTNALLNRGNLLSEMGRYSEAAATFIRANETDPFNINASDGLKAARTGESRNNQNATNQPMTILIVIVLVAAIGIIVWYVKFRKPADPAPEEKKNNSKKKE